MTKQNDSGERSPRHYSLKVETGVFTVVGNPVELHVTRSPVANSAIAAIETSAEPSKLKTAYVSAFKIIGDMQDAELAALRAQLAEPTSLSPGLYGIDQGVSPRSIDVLVTQVLEERKKQEGATDAKKSAR